MSDLTRVQELEEALRTMAYAYLRILEIGPTSAFAARAYRRACELVEVDPASKHLYATPPDGSEPQVLTELEEEIARSAGVRITHDMDDSDRALMTGLLMIIDRLAPMGATS